MRHASGGKHASCEHSELIAGDECTSLQRAGTHLKVPVRASVLELFCITPVKVVFHQIQERGVLFEWNPAVDTMRSWPPHCNNQHGSAHSEYLESTLRPRTKKMHTLEMMKRQETMQVGPCVQVNSHDRTVGLEQPRSPSLAGLKALD